MAVLKPEKEIQNQSDYEQSIRYGRPIFAKMHEKDEVEQKIGKVLSRLLLDAGKDGFDWSQHTESCLSVLATQVQMGFTKLSVVSTLVSKGYAYLTGFTSNFCNIRLHARSSLCSPCHVYDGLILDFFEITR
jgi:hypothetical protein